MEDNVNERYDLMKECESLTTFQDLYHYYNLYYILNEQYCDEVDN